LRFLFDLFLFILFLFLLDLFLFLRPPPCVVGAVGAVGAGGCLGLGGPIGFTCEKVVLLGAAVGGAATGGCEVRGLECADPILSYALIFCMS
jgi:hypothetical protein